MLGKNAKCKECGEAFEINIKEGNSPRGKAILKPSPEPNIRDNQRVTDAAPNTHRASERHMDPDKHLEAGRELLGQGDYEAARRHFRMAYNQAPGIERFRDALHDALKYDHWWTRFFRRYGLIPPGSALVVAPWSKVTFWILVGIIPGICLKIIRSNPDYRDALWPVIVVCGLILIVSRLADYVSTIRLWKSEYHHSIVTPGDLIGASVGVALMVVAAVCAVIFLFSGFDFTWIAIGITSFVSARPIQLACKTRSGLPRWVVMIYVALVVSTGVTSLVLVLTAVDGTDWSSKLHPLGGRLFLAYALGVLLTKPFRALVLELSGTQRDYVDHSTQAATPGTIALSDKKLRMFHPELYGIRSLFHRLTHGGRGVSAKDCREMVREHLMYGDTNPAVVLSTHPLLIAAYAEDLDCVVVLEFENWLINEYELTNGLRLLSINTFEDMSQRDMGNDLVWGPKHTNTWGNTCPFIAEFLSDDIDTINEKKAELSQEDWQRAIELARDWKRRPSARPRDGYPLLCHVSRDVLE